MISAIITTYQREPAMVMRALDSVLRQTYRELEIIVVDDSPPGYPLRDDVRKAVLERQKANQEIPIRYVAHEKNMGACVARNTGLKTAEGEYVAYLDDDDEWLPKKLEKQMKVMAESNAGLVYCGRICVNDGKGTRTASQMEYVRGKAFIKLLNTNFIASTSYPLIRRECLKAIGGFDPLMSAAQDYDAWLRLSERYEIDYVAEPLVLYHEHDGERITTNPEKKISGLERINAKYADHLRADRKLWWKRNVCLVSYYAMAGKGKKAWSLWWKCVCKCPEKCRGNAWHFYIIIKTMMKK